MSALDSAGLITSHSATAFDFLNTADWIVEDAGKAAARVSEILGLPKVREEWRQGFASHQYQAIFGRAGDSLTVAPTRFEFLSLPDAADKDVDPCSVAPLAEIQRMQGHRNQRIHATVLTVSDLDSFVEDLVRRGITHWIERGCIHLPFPRVWLGWTGPDSAYAFGSDPGFFFEVVPTQGHGDRIVASVTSPPVGRAGVSRIQRRVFLATDLEAAASFVRTTTGLSAGASTRDEFNGFDSVAFGFRHPGSAELVVATPFPHGFATDYMEKWGTGMFLTTVKVADPSRTIEHAERMGAVVLNGSSLKGRAVIEDPSLDGILVEVC